MLYIILVFLTQPKLVQNIFKKINTANKAVRKH